MKMEMKRKKTSIATCISDKTDFEERAVTRDKGGHYTDIQGSIQQEDTTVNIYVSNREPKYTKQIITDIKSDTDNV